MKVVFETMLPLPFYAQLHVLYTELCLKYYQGKKKGVIFICTSSYFSSATSVMGSENKQNKQPDS